MKRNKYLGMGVRKASNAEVFLLVTIFTLSCQNKTVNDKSYKLEFPSPSKEVELIYDFEKSKYQVHTTLDSIVNKNSFFYSFKYNEFSFQYELKYKNGKMIVFYLYYAGDDLAYLSHPDSVRLVLKDVREIVVDDKALVTRPLLGNELNLYLMLFDSLLIQTTRQILKDKKPFFVKSLNEKNKNNLYRFLIGKNSIVHDTIELVKFRGRYRISTEVDLSKEYEWE